MTGSIKLISRWERFKRLTVWHPINVDPKDDERWTVQFWLPLYDALAALAGIVAFYIGSPFLNRLFPGWVVDIGAVMLIWFGAVTLIGVVIPNLWRVEVLGKMGMSFLLMSYALLLLSFPTAGGLSNLFVTIILTMATWGVYPRLTKLFIRGFRASRARKRAAAESKVA